MPECARLLRMCDHVASTVGLGIRTNFFCSAAMYILVARTLRSEVRQAQYSFAWEERVSQEV